MVASIQDHFHLMTTMPAAAELTGEWEADATNVQPSMIPEVQVFAAPKYGLTGKLYTHVLKSGVDPVQKTNYQFRVLLTSYADFLTWLTYAGREMYFVPNQHDPLDHQTYVKYMYVERIGRAEAEGYKYDVLKLPVQLLDLTT